MNESSGLSPAVQACSEKGWSSPRPARSRSILRSIPTASRPASRSTRAAGSPAPRPPSGPAPSWGARRRRSSKTASWAAKVALKGGYFSGATFLDGANMGSAAHVRPGTLLEEEAGGAHAVGFKQTLFLPYRHGRQPDQLLRRADGRRDQPQEPQRDRLVLHPLQLHAAPGQGHAVADRRRAARGDAGPAARSSWAGRAAWWARCGSPTAPSSRPA